MTATLETQHKTSEKRPKFAHALRILSVPIILFWIAIAVLVNVIAPPLEVVGELHAAPMAPEDALAQMGADPSEAAPEEERDPDAPAFTLEIALLVTRREFLSIKRKLRKLGGGDMGAGLIHLMNEEEA